MSGEIHVCPIWEDPDGTRRPGFEYEGEDHPPVVGWCCIEVLRVGGEWRPFLLAWEEDELGGHRGR